jgi:hypothetical protein
MAAPQPPVDLTDEERRAGRGLKLGRFGGVSVRGSGLARRAALGAPVLLVLAAAFTVRGALGDRSTRDPAGCAGCVRLRPVETPGRFWETHRHWLVAPMPFGGAPYVVLNARTSLGYRWTFKGNLQGRAWFGVRTRWTWFHRGWKDDPWLLAYDCG